MRARIDFRAEPAYPNHIIFWTFRRKTLATLQRAKLRCILISRAPPRPTACPNDLVRASDIVESPKLKFEGEIKRGPVGVVQFPPKTGVYREIFRCLCQICLKFFTCMYSGSKKYVHIV